MGERPPGGATTCASQIFSNNVRAIAAPATSRLSSGHLARARSPELGLGSLSRRGALGKTCARGRGARAAESGRCREEVYGSASVAEKAPLPSEDALHITLLAVSAEDPQTTLNPLAVLAPQTTELPHTTELPDRLAPQTTDEPQTTDD